MATVYLANDVRHNRAVALKVLKPELGAVLGAERFLTEIRVTANLQHPNLLPLFDSGEANGLLFYVMPFVEGESLRARLDRENQLPVDEAVRIASAVASALEYAHAHHVIHRDLKPENILLQGGQPIIADFGIALAVSNAGGARVTQTGLSLGTPQYMSPEQATGDRQLDARSDIYSLSAVTYEMLAGDPPHLGSSAQSIIAKVLTEKPPSVRIARPSVPEHVAYAIEKGLEKLSADRWRSAAEFDAALTGRSGPAPALATAASRAPAAEGAAWTRSRIARVLVSPIGVAALAFALVATAFGWWRTARRAPTTPTIRFTLEAPSGTKISGFEGSLAISRDGRLVAFGAGPEGRRSQLYVRAVDAVEARALSGTEGATHPFFSPDGAWLGYLSDGQVKKVRIDGGRAFSLADVANPGGQSWSARGQIVVSTGGQLVVVSENGGAPRVVVGNDSIRGSARAPIFLADGETVLYALWRGSVQDSQIYAVSTVTGRITDLHVAGIAVLGSVGGDLVYVASGGSVMLVPFDERALRTTGEPMEVMSGVSVGGISTDVAAKLSASGNVVYQYGSALSELVSRDGRGAERLLAREQRTFRNPRLSPDARHLAVDVQAQRGRDVWLYDLAAGTGAKVAAAGTLNTRPEWTPDGKRLLYRTNRDTVSSLWWQPIDGSGSPERLLRVKGTDVWEGVISPDRNWLLYRTGTLGSADIWYRRLSGDTTSQPFATTRFQEDAARFSPDGKWVAYASNELGKYQVFVRRFPAGGGRYQVSVGEGHEPVWSRDGSKLYFVSRPNTLLRAHVTTNPEFSVTARDTVSVGRYVFASGHADYDVFPDGERSLLLRPVQTEVATIVALNVLGAWRAQLEKDRRR